jgi:hypothetical protein
MGSHTALGMRELPAGTVTFLPQAATNDWPMHAQSAYFRRIKTVFCPIRAQDA